MSRTWIVPNWAARIAFVMGCSLVMPFLGGCGDDGVGSRYSVSGTVKRKGQLLEKGSITFTPKDASKGRTATGAIENGKYTLSTMGNNDGAIPGEYIVGISSRVADLSKASVNAEKTGGLMRQDDVAKAYQEAAKGAIPTKYEIGETSGLTAKVEARSNTFDFDIPD